MDLFNLFANSFLILFSTIWKSFDSKHIEHIVKTYRNNNCENIYENMIKIESCSNKEYNKGKEKNVC